MRRPGRHRGQGGWILFDTLIGAVILTIGLVGASLVFNEGQQSISRVAEHQTASRLAASLLSIATAYGCGAETGFSLPGPAPDPPLPGYPSTAAIWDQCAELYAGQAGAPSSGALGDPADLDAVGGTTAAWSTPVGGTTYAISYRAVWTQAAVSSDGCPQTLLGGAAAIAPIGQTRTVTVQWVDQGHDLNFSASLFSGVPVDAVVYSSSAAGGIVVTGMAPGSMARLVVPVDLFDPDRSGVVLVDRVASVPAGGSAGCAWFPFLAPAPAGTYLVHYFTSGDPDGAPSATSPTDLTVQSGAVSTWSV